MTTIREAKLADWDGIWEIFNEVVQAGDTYTYDTHITKDAAKVVWLDQPRKTFVVAVQGRILATYYMKTNQSGNGSHVCNCGYMVASHARGQGLATHMCQHSQRMALELGYLAMQFNFVVSTNTGAITLWNQLGFETVGRLPRAFNHPTQGLVDALVMYKWLDAEKVSEPLV